MKRYESDAGIIIGVGIAIFLLFLGAGFIVLTSQPIENYKTLSQKILESQQSIEMQISELPLQCNQK